MSTALDKKSDKLVPDEIICKHVHADEKDAETINWVTQIG